MENQTFLMDDFCFGKNISKEHSLIESLKEFLCPMSENDKIAIVVYGLEHENYDNYINNMAEIFSAMGYNNLVSVHTYEKPIDLIQDSDVKAIFVSGNNVSILKEELVDKLIFTAIRRAVERGIKYVGSDAGSKIFPLLMA